jgi:hypothetical protein
VINHIDYQTTHHTNFRLMQSLAKIGLVRNSDIFNPELPKKYITVLTGQLVTGNPSHSERLSK